MASLLYDCCRFERLRHAESKHTLGLVPHIELFSETERYTVAQVAMFFMHE